MKDLKKDLKEKTAHFKSIERRSKVNRTLKEDQTLKLSYKIEEPEPGFAYVPFSIINDTDLDVNSISAYVHLRSMASWKGICNPGIKHLAARMRRSSTTVKLALTLLHKKTHICKVKVHDKSDVYIILADFEDKKARLSYLLSFTPLQLWNACEWKDKYHKHKKI